MAQMQMLKEVGSTAGGQVAKRIFSEVDEMRHYPDKYSETEEARFNALKAIHDRIFHFVPDRWTLDPENKTPHRMLMDGTWENHWQRELRDKKTTPLRGEVENMLYVISGYLDERRKDIWRYINVSGIKRGDVEEQFFGEVMVWLKDILDGPVDEMLEGKIEKYKQYLHEVLISTEVFPKQHIHDKSPSKKIVSKLFDMLGDKKEEVEKIQAQQFTLRKFEEISIATKTMVQHFLKGFSYFSPVLRVLDALKVPDLQTSIKKSDTRFSQLFLLFVQNFYQDNAAAEFKCAEAEGLFDPSQFMACMRDETRQTGLPKSMPKELVKLIPDIFLAAYRLSQAMQLIREASSTLSEQGTIRLFCNTEGRNYFEFLLEHFKSVKDVFISKMALFNEKGMVYMQKIVADTGENPSKESETGQYSRFRESFRDVESDDAALESHLANTTRQIRSFAGKTPEEAEIRRENLYAKIREEMRKANRHTLADELEKLAMQRIKKTNAALPSRIVEEKREVPSAMLARSSFYPNPPEAKAMDVPFFYDLLPESRKRSIEDKEKKELFIREKIEIALDRLYASEASFLSAITRSNITSSFLGALIKILEDSKTLPLSVFYTLIGDFVASVRYANENGKVKNAYEKEEFYIVLSELYFLLSEPAYTSLIFSRLEAETLKKISDELSAAKMQKEALEERLVSRNQMIVESNQEIQRQAECIQRSESLIRKLEDLVGEKKKEISDLELDMRRKTVQIGEQAEEIGKLKKESVIQKQKSDEMDEKLGKMDEKMEQFLNFVKQNFVPKPNAALDESGASLVHAC